MVGKKGRKRANLRGVQHDVLLKGGKNLKKKKRKTEKAEDVMKISLCESGTKQATPIFHQQKRKKTLKRGKKEGKKEGQDLVHFFLNSAEKRKKGPPRLPR